MENNSKNKISSKYGFQTPKLINKKTNLRKTKSSGNILAKNFEHFPTLKTPMNATRNKHKEFNIKNSIYQQKNSYNLTEQNLINKVKNIKINFSLKLSKENIKLKHNNKNKDDINNKETNEKKINKPKLNLSKSLNIIPLPVKKYSGSPKILSKNNSLKSITNKSLKNETNLKREKEEINKTNIKNSARNSPNSARPKSKTKNFEFLYLPHIVLDPLDVLKNQIEIILQKFEKQIKNLNELNSEENIQQLQTDYANKLYLLYQEKGNELVKIKDEYNKEMYNISYKDAKMTEEELKKNIDIKMKEIEKLFNEKKQKLKNEFNTKIENIKNSFNINEQIELNKKLIFEIKNKFLKIFKDKNMLNKKGINFSLKDYKNIMKKSNIKTSKLRNSSFNKK